MMSKPIEKLFIPTLSRTDNQSTYNDLPNKWKDKTYLVVQEWEAYKYKILGYKNIISLPPDIVSLSPTKEYIAKVLGQGIRYGILDDDLEFIYTHTPSSGIKPTNRPLADFEYDFLFEELLPSWMDAGYLHIGMEPIINFPREKDFQDNFRIMQVVFYDGKKLDCDKYDWSRLLFSEDFDVCLQLLKDGNPNRVSGRYRYKTRETQADGGYSIYRTTKLHNEHFKQLAEYHAPYVELYTKEASLDESDIKKYGARIKWKEIYKPKNDFHFEKIYC